MLSKVVRIALLSLILALFTFSQSFLDKEENKTQISLSPGSIAYAEGIEAVVSGLSREAGIQAKEIAVISRQQEEDRQRLEEIERQFADELKKIITQYEHDSSKQKEFEGRALSSLFDLNARCVDSF